MDILVLDNSVAQRKERFHAYAFNNVCYIFKRIVMLIFYINKINGKDFQKSNLISLYFIIAYK